MEQARLRFSTHGYLAVLVNRFLFGSRAVISIMAGLMHLKVAGVFFAALASSVVWYVLLLYGGYLLGNNWAQIGTYMAAYTIPVTLIIACVVIYAVFRYAKNRQHKQDV